VQNEDELHIHLTTRTKSTNPLSPAQVASIVALQVARSRKIPSFSSSTSHVLQSTTLPLDLCVLLALLLLPQFLPSLCSCCCTFYFHLLSGCDRSLIIR